MASSARDSRHGISKPKSTIGNLGLTQTDGLPWISGRITFPLFPDSRFVAATAHAISLWLPLQGGGERLEVGRAVEFHCLPDSPEKASKTHRAANYTQYFYFRVRFPEYQTNAPRTGQSTNTLNRPRPTARPGRIGSNGAKDGDTKPRLTAGLRRWFDAGRIKTFPTACPRGAGRSLSSSSNCERLGGSASGAPDSLQVDRNVRRLRVHGSPLSSLGTAGRREAHTASGRAASFQTRFPGIHAAARRTDATPTRPWHRKTAQSPKRRKHRTRGPSRIKPPAFRADSDLQAACDRETRTGISRRSRNANTVANLWGKLLFPLRDTADLRLRCSAIAEPAPGESRLGSRLGPMRFNVLRTSHHTDGRMCKWLNGIGKLRSDEQTSFPRDTAECSVSPFGSTHGRWRPGEPMTGKSRRSRKASTVANSRRKTTVPASGYCGSAVPMLGNRQGEYGFASRSLFIAYRVVPMRENHDPRGLNACRFFHRMTQCIPGRPDEDAGDPPAPKGPGYRP